MRVRSRRLLVVGTRKSSPSSLLTRTTSASTLLPTVSLPSSSHYLISANPYANADDLLASTLIEPGVQAWSGTGGYDGQDSRRKIHGGKAVENQDDGYKVPPAFAMEFHSGEQCPLAPSK